MKIVTQWDFCKESFIRENDISELLPTDKRFPKKVRAKIEKIIKKNCQIFEKMEEDAVDYSIINHEKKKIYLLQNISYELQENEKTIKEKRVWELTEITILENGEIIEKYLGWTRKFKKCLSNCF